MYTASLTVLALGATLVAGADLAGFQLAQEPTLIVAYGQTAAMNGVVVARDVTALQPILAVPASTTATSVAIMMVDLDIPSATKPTTFLHWLQTDLVVASQATNVATSSGNMQGFAVSPGQNTSAIVDYTQPSPPPKNPLSHRYTELLLDTSALTQSSLAVLKTAAQNRVNFNIKTTLEQAGLSNSVIAWNFFNVTNSEGTTPAANGASTSNSTATTGNGANKATNSNGTATSETSNNKPAESSSGSGGAAAATNITGTGTKAGATSDAAAASNSTAGTVTTAAAAGRQSLYNGVLSLCLLGAVMATF